MTDNDMIRRGDALTWVDAWGREYKETYLAIAALPAVTVGVRGHNLRSLLAKAVDDLSVGREVDLIALERSVLAALDLTFAPRRYMGQTMAECDCPREAEFQAAGRCIAEGRR